jgi:hypothetical protein
LDSLGFSSEPPVYSQPLPFVSHTYLQHAEVDSPGEAQSIVELSLTLSNRLASLIGNNLCNVISVLSNECIPFQEPLSSCSRVDLAIRLKSRMSCLNSLVYILRSIIRSRSPSLSSSRICTRSFSGLVFDGITKSNDSIPTTSKRFLDCASTNSPLIRVLSRHMSLLFS